MKIIAMRTSISVNRMIACMLFLFFMAVGCKESEPPAPAKPVVVKKRIAMEAPVVRAPQESPPAVKSAETAAVPPKKPAEATAAPVKKPAPPPAVASPENRDLPTVAAGKPESEKRIAAAVSGVSLTQKIEDEIPRYDPKDKIDPFEPLFKERPRPTAVVSTEKQYKRRRPQTPLEKIDLSQLKLVGVIRSDRANRAMVEDATGKGYVITKGSYVGINGGRVIKIEKDRAFIEEELEDIFGKISVSRKELKLQKPAGEE